MRERDDKVSELREALATLDKDHDALLAEADEKSETIAHLKSELEGKEHGAGEAQTRLSQLQGELAHIRGQLEERVKATTNLQTQFEGRGQELEDFREQCRSLVREKTQLKDDLNTMTQVS